MGNKYIYAFQILIHGETMLGALVLLSSLPQLLADHGVIILGGQGLDGPLDTVSVLTESGWCPQENVIIPLYQWLQRVLPPTTVRWWGTVQTGRESTSWCADSPRRVLATRSLLLMVTMCGRLSGQRRMT